jgi:hypothetical protein
MHPQLFPAYHHSGKFGFHGPVFALAAAAVLAVPMGLVYSYVTKWIPFIYANFLATAGYGWLAGMLAGFCMRQAWVRNTPVAIASGLGVGLLALYGDWNGHIRALFDEASLINPPEVIFRGMKVLYENGSWGMSSGGAVTGIPLAIVWFVEAAMIVGIAVVISRSMVAEVPFCETCHRWLKDKRIINTLASFDGPDQLTALKSGDLGPLADAKARVEGSATYAKLIIQHSSHCDEFCTVRVENVKVQRKSDGDFKAVDTALTGNLMLPVSMLSLIERFEGFGDSAAALTIPKKQAD